MNAANDRERLFIGRCALVLFIAGLLLPFIIGGLLLTFGGMYLSLGTEIVDFYLCLGFGFIAELLALALGIVGRRHLSGKVGMYGATVVCALAVTYVGALLWHSLAD